MNWLWFFFSFKGRITRKPYWMFNLATVATELLIVITGELYISFDSEIYAGYFLILVSWPILAVHAKRWHDRDKTAWLFLLSGFWPVTAWILIECALAPGNPDENRFGMAPADYSSATGKADRYHPALIILLIGSILLSICYSGFRIPAGSMSPTLLVGDFLIVNRIAYGIPVPYSFREAIPVKNPVRGDIIVFRFPKDPSLTYIKRIVGEPGDHIGYLNRRISINGKSLNTKSDRLYGGPGDRNMIGSVGGCDRIGAKCEVFIEQVEQGSYTVMTNPDVKNSSDGETVVPEGHYFVMGDNRDYSHDSRNWGFVPRDYVIGKAVLVWMHWDWSSGGNGLDISRVGRRFINKNGSDE